MHAPIDPLPMGTLAPTAPGKSVPMSAISQSKIKQTKISKYTNSQTEIDLKKSKMKLDFSDGSTNAI